MAEQAKWWHKPMLPRLGLKRLIISFAFCEQLIPTILFFLLSWKVHVSLTVVQSLRHFHGSEGRLLLLSAWRLGGWGCGSGVVLVTLCPLFRAVWLVVAGSLALCCLIRCPVCRQQCFGIKIKNLYWYTSGLRSDDASKVCVHLVEYEPIPLGLCTPGCGFWTCIWTHSSASQHVCSLWHAHSLLCQEYELKRFFYFILLSWLAGRNPVLKAECEMWHGSQAHCIRLGATRLPTCPQVCQPHCPVPFLYNKAS